MKYEKIRCPYCGDDIAELSFRRRVYHRLTCHRKELRRKRLI